MNITTENILDLIIDREEKLKAYEAAALTIYNALSLDNMAEVVATVLDQDISSSNDFDMDSSSENRYFEALSDLNNAGITCDDLIRDINSTYNFDETITIAMSSALERGVSEDTILSTILDHCDYVVTTELRGLAWGVNVLNTMSMGSQELQIDDIIYNPETNLEHKIADLIIAQVELDLESKNITLRDLIQEKSEYFIDDGFTQISDDRSNHTAHLQVDYKMIPDLIAELEQLKAEEA